MSGTFSPGFDGFTSYSCLFCGIDASIEGYAVSTATGAGFDATVGCFLATVGFFAADGFLADEGSELSLTSGVK